MGVPNKVVNAVRCRMIAQALIDACAQKRAAYQAFADVLDVELPRACTRVNNRELIFFTIESISYGVDTIGQNVLKIFAGTLKSRETKKVLAEGIFSQEIKREYTEILCPAFAQELGIVGVFDAVEFFIDSHYLK